LRQQGYFDIIIIILYIFYYIIIFLFFIVCSAVGPRPIKNKIK